MPRSRRMAKVFSRQAKVFLSAAPRGAVTAIVSTPKLTTAREILDKTTAFFTEKGVPSARLDAEVLLAEVLGYDRLRLYMNLDRPMDDAEIARARDMVRRRAAREPVAYIIGRKEFAGRSFKVGTGVLIPRPDTELLVEETARELRGRFDQDQMDRADETDETDLTDQANLTDLTSLTSQSNGPGSLSEKLDHPSGQSNPSDTHSGIPAHPPQPAPTSISEPLRVLEFGIGSGAIAVTLAADNHRLRVTATEISESAASIARENATTHGVADRVEIKLQPDFAGLAGPFHAIVSNPPYINPVEKPDLAPDVINFEPADALFAEDAGLRWYSFLATEATRLLMSGGFIAVEIGYRQRVAVEKIFTDAGLKLTRSVKDFARNDRVVIAER